jgi:hypothetical protein
MRAGYKQRDMHARRRLYLGLLLVVAALAVAMLAGGLISTMLALIAGLIVVDALVPNFHTPMFGKLPADKRRRLRGR